MICQLDLFSSNNIVVSSSKKIDNTTYSSKKEIKLSTPLAPPQQEELFSLNIVVNDQKLRLTKKFYKHQNALKNKNTDSSKERRIKNWHRDLLHKIKGSVRTKNRRNNKNYLKDLEKHKEYMAYELPSIEPIKPEHFPYPNFDRDFLQKLWDIQEGRDAYTNQPMIIDSKLKAFNPSGDRISSKLPYQKGNMVLCCFSTNVCKFEFDIYDEGENSWINYITNKDPAKKQEIYERIERIQKLSLLE